MEKKIEVGKKTKKIVDKKEKKEKEEKKEREIIYVDINQIMERAKEEIMSTRGGIDYSEIEYEGDIDKLKFSIPKKTRKGKCQEICYPDEEGGCGSTGGSCLCGESEDHEGDHICEECGHNW